MLVYITYITYSNLLFLAKKCSSFGTIENGKVLSTKTDFHFGDIVSFQCDFGYEMSGGSILICNSNGEWNGTAPSCKCKTVFFIFVASRTVKSIKK